MKKKIFIVEDDMFYASLLKNEILKSFQANVKLYHCVICLLSNNSKRTCTKQEVNKLQSSNHKFINNLQISIYEMTNYIDFSMI